MHLDKIEISGFKSFKDRTVIEFPDKFTGFLFLSIQELLIIKMENKFTAVFEKVDDWWIGYIEELPGANTQGRTLDEVRENLKEAVQLIIEANRELARRETINHEVIREEISVGV